MRVFSKIVNSPHKTDELQIEYCKSRHSSATTCHQMSYSYYGRRDSPPGGESGMYGRDRSPPPQSGRRSPMARIPKISSSSTLDDLRNEFSRITEDTPSVPTMKIEDMTWDKMGNKVQDMAEKLANDPNAEGAMLFPPPQRRKRDRREMPLIINGNIGLEYVIEYIDPDGQSPRVYHCRLCKQFNTCSSIMEHVTGYNHRVRFIANKYPNQAKTYLMPDGRRANRNVALIKMAQGRAQELELVYGRGEWEIRNERPSIPDETQIDVESDIITVESGQQTEVLKHCLKQIKACKLEGDEDIRIAKQIINDLTDAIIEFKQSAQDKQMNTGINSLLRDGRDNRNNY